MRPVAYEYQCLKTGHCYVDYVRRSDIEEGGEVYTPKPLIYEFNIKELMEYLDQNPDLFYKLTLELRRKKLEKLRQHGTV